ncbi:tail fiber domain-containing protein [Bacillus toyonensis]|nr:tail fiber domain-containing protein [Bacillus toyonensis]
MSNLVGDSFDDAVPALQLNNSRLPAGMLIRGHSPQGMTYVLTHAGMWIAGGISAGGDIFARGVKLSSDKNAKENFSSVNTQKILDKLTNMPIQTWSYKNDRSDERHIGPTAQDFYATFGLNGDNETQISTIDLQGVALAAIQGLNEKLKVENANLHEKLAYLEERLLALESKW